MATIQFANAFMGYATLSTDHAASSHGIPVLVDEHGNAYGPADPVRSASDPLAFLYPEIQTAADVVRAYAIADYKFMEPRSDYDARIAAAKLFLGSHA